jgi:glycosyltransferase involved in cell wall biosynthesis
MHNACVDRIANHRPRVSVLLPVRNGARTLARAIATVQSQTFRDWELIAVDDGSTDESGALLESLARRDPRIRVLRQGALGLVTALNAGLDAARGEWIARMDADDECLPDRLEAQTAFLQEHPEIGLVGSLVEFVASQENGTGYALHVAWLNSVVSADDVDIARFIESPFAHPSVMFRRELAETRGRYLEGDFPEDYELWLRWLDAGTRMAKVNRVLLRWHDSPTRLSRKDPRYDTEAFYRLKARYLAPWLERNLRGRPLWLWGAGRATRKRSEELVARGIPVEARVDIDPRKRGCHRGGWRVVGPDSIPPPGSVFIVGYVGSRGARELQREFLRARGHVEGRDFIFAA